MTIIISIILLAIFWRLFAGLLMGSLALIGIVVIIMAILSGCASKTPKTTAECSTMYTIPIEIDACEERVVRIEDGRYRRALERAMKERCRWPNIWDARIGVCRSHIYY